MGLLLFAYHFLTACFPCPDNFLSMCYMPRTDSKLQGEPFWGCCCVRTVSLSLASHVLTNFLTICYMPRIDSKMRGGAVLGLLQFAYHILAACFPCPHNFLTLCYMPRMDSKLRGEPFWGCCCLHTLLHHLLTMALQFPHYLLHAQN